MMNPITPPYRSSKPATIPEFRAILNDYSVKSVAAMKDFEGCKILLNCNPIHTVGFLKRYRSFHDFILNEIKRYNRNVDISMMNMRNEEVQFNITPILIWERVLTRLFNAFMDDRMDHQCSMAMQALNATREIKQCVETRTVAGMKLVHLEFIDEKEEEQNRRNQEQAILHRNERLKDVKTQSKKLLSFIKNNPEKIRILEEKEVIAGQKYCDEIYFYHLCAPYEDFVNIYEAKFKEKVPPPQFLIRNPPLHSRVASTGETEPKRIRKNSEDGNTSPLKESACLEDMPSAAVGNLESMEHYSESALLESGSTLMETDINDLGDEEKAAASEEVGTREKDGTNVLEIDVKETLNDLETMEKSPENALQQLSPAEVTKEKSISAEDSSEHSEELSKPDHQTENCSEDKKDKPLDISSDSRTLVTSPNASCSTQAEEMQTEATQPEASEEPFEPPTSITSTDLAAEQSETVIETCPIALTSDSNVIKPDSENAEDSILDAPEASNEALKNSESDEPQEPEKLENNPESSGPKLTEELQELVVPVQDFPASSNPEPDNSNQTINGTNTDFEPPRETEPTTSTQVPTPTEAHSPEHSADFVRGEEQDFELTRGSRSPQFPEVLIRRRDIPSPGVRYIRPSNQIPRKSSVITESSGSTDSDPSNQSPRSPAISSVWSDSDGQEGSGEDGSEGTPLPRADQIPLNSPSPQLGTSAQSDLATNLTEEARNLDETSVSEPTCPGPSTEVLTEEVDMDGEDPSNKTAVISPAPPSDAHVVQEVTNSSIPEPLPQSSDNVPSQDVPDNSEQKSEILENQNAPEALNPPRDYNIPTPDSYHSSDYSSNPPSPERLSPPQARASFSRVGSSDDDDGLTGVKDKPRSIEEPQSQSSSNADAPVIEQRQSPKPEDMLREANKGDVGTDGNNPEVIEEPLEGESLIDTPETSSSGNGNN